MDQQLIKLDQARQLLAEASTIQEVKKVIDMAELAEIYAKKVKLGEEAENYARGIKLDAQRKAGEYLTNTIKSGNPQLSHSTTIGLNEIGITRDQSSKWQQLAQLPDESIEKIKQGELSIKNAIIKQKRTALSKEKVVSLLPTGEFNVIYADPPWQYDFIETENRAIENQYPTMAFEEIKLLQVPSAKDSVLFLWATAPKLEEALEVLKVWGFKYRTCAVWDKKIIGMGYWFRNQHELLLVGVKGNFSPPIPENRFSSVIDQRREKHSKKPEIVYDMIETMFPHAKYLELFSRAKREKWTMWGNETL